jgi:hypothetical protein
MTIIRAVVRGSRIEVPAPEGFPDGTAVRVELSPLAGKVGLDESEWSDGPEALADWAAWLDTIEPISFPEADAFDEEFRRFNIEAVRRQMSGGGG